MASTSAVAQIMAKIARNATQLGLTVNSNTGSAVVIENGSNDLTVSYVAPTITSPMGGIDPSVSPFLGVGVVNPGVLKVTSAIHTAGTIADVLDSAVAAKVLHMLGGFSNDKLLSNDDGSFTLSLRGDVDNLGLGQ